MPPKKNLSSGCLSNWCDADEDADADSSKTICRPPPYGGVDLMMFEINLLTQTKVKIKNTFAKNPDNELDINHQQNPQGSF